MMRRAHLVGLDHHLVQRRLRPERYVHAHVEAGVHGEVGRPVADVGDAEADRVGRSGEAEEPIRIGRHAAPQIGGAGATS